VTHVDLFSGIGGFALACRHVGLDTICFCESDPYCQRVLAKHWPDVPITDDIRQFNGHDWPRPDLLTAGFPCTDISIAQTHRERDVAGESTGLFAEMVRVIGEARPRIALLENVTNLLSGDAGRWFGQLLGELAKIGYDAEWHCIPSAHIGAPHQRDRVFIVANPNGEGLEGLRETGKRAGEWFAGAIFQESVWDQLTADCVGMANGIPKRVDRLRALGNAVCVPLVVQILVSLFKHQPSVSQSAAQPLPDDLQSLR
jgi:DNA (cytosine-5)-methyltransferase 1